MAASVIVDASFLVALLRERDESRQWAAAQAGEYPYPWFTCEPALTEAMYLLGAAGSRQLIGLLRRPAIRAPFDFDENREAVLSLMEKYASVPMSFADACLVRMTEILPDPMILTTDSDFRVYRRHNRQVVPCILPR